MEIKLQVVIDGSAYELEGIEYISVDTSKERDVTIQSTEKGYGNHEIALKIKRTKD